jgi:hypothetical protein
MDGLHGARIRRGMRIFKRMHMVVVAALMAVMLSFSAAVAFAAPDPTDPKTACKGDGYLTVAGLDELGEPTILFANQGECVSFVEAGGTIQPIEITV